MNGYVTGAAHWLDAWLREHMGRAYAGILGLGLGLGIATNIQSLSHAMGSGVNILKIGGMVLFELVLLVNQLAQLHEYRQERRQRRAARKSRATPPAPPQS